ncbi:MMPL family transporter [Nocardia jinanensis]|nr:MMPL family transporter [Nocardia jinanensis]
MANYLNRLGRYAFTQRRTVLAVWIVLLALIGTGAAAFHNVGSGAALTVPGTESQDARDALAREFPQAAGASGSIALRAAPGTTFTEPGGRAVLAEVADAARGLDGVSGVVTPEQSGAVTPDGRYAIIQVQFTQSANDISPETKQAYEQLGTAIAERSGATIAPGGEVATPDPEVGATEIIGVAVAAVVLVLTFGSLIAAGMTMLTALVGVGVGTAGIYAASGFVTFTGVTPILALMLGLAVGIDYALFITARYRQELAKGRSAVDAAGRAIGTAGSAVVFAGSTVIIALAALSAVGIPFLSTMGLAAAAAVLVAVLVALTLTPAMLGFAGDRIQPRAPRSAAPAGDGASAVPAEKPTAGARWVGIVTRRPVRVVAITVLGLIVVALPARDMQLGLPTNGTATEATAARISYDLITEGFGEGYNSQIVVVAGPDTPERSSAATTALGAALGELDGVTAVAPAQFAADGRTSLTTVVPAGGPADPATEKLIATIRSDIAPGIDATIAVTGVAAVAIDVSDTLTSALPIYLAIVIGLSLILLTVVFRSVLVPLKAALGFLLTTAATFGATVAVFQWGWLADVLGVDSTGPIVSFLPIILIGVTFGLSMDYEVFLVSRMREDYLHGADARTATVTGFTHSARVVTAAAVIMIAVFSAFVLAPDPTVKMIGFSLAVGVVVDAFLVRMTIVPAVMSLLGDRAWRLPKWLDRVVPTIDIEGAALENDGRTGTGADARPEGEQDLVRA